MIHLRRLNGTELWLNPLLMESVERTPDTIVTLTNGHKYVISESPEVIASLAADFLKRVGLVGTLHSEPGKDGSE